MYVTNIIVALWPLCFWGGGVWQTIGLVRFIEYEINLAWLFIAKLIFTCRCVYCYTVHIGTLISNVPSYQSQNLPISAQTACATLVASGTSQQNSPVGDMTLALRRFRLTVPSSPLVLLNDVGFPSGPGTVIIPPGKSHSPSRFGGAWQHSNLSVMHWSPVLDVVLVSPISLMGMTLLLA